MWHVEYICFICGKVLTNKQRFYTGAVCPHCGYKSRASYTMVHTKERIYRWKRPWWKFWIKQEKIYKE